MLPCETTHVAEAGVGLLTIPSPTLAAAAFVYPDPLLVILSESDCPAETKHPVPVSLYNTTDGGDSYFGNAAITC
jgi:hypothetical protein